MTGSSAVALLTVAAAVATGAAVAVALPARPRLDAGRAAALAREADAGAAPGSRGVGFDVGPEAGRPRGSGPWPMPGPAALSDPGPARPTAGPARWRWWAAAAALVGAICLVPGPGAGPVGVAAAIGVWWVAGRAEPAAVRRERLLAARQLPHLVELLGSALAAGAAPGPVLERVCAALPGPAADLLRPTRAALALGVAPHEVWGRLAGHPVLAPLGRAMVRAHESGAPVVDVVRDLADDLAAEARSAVEDRARSVGVRAALPLGVCLLPAFLLLGIVPLVASAVAAIDW